MKLTSFFLSLRMKPKLMLLFIMTGLIPLIIVALIGSYFTATALQELAFDNLRIIQNIKRDKLLNVFQERVGNLKLQADMLQTGMAIQELLHLSSSQGMQTDSPEYRNTHADLEQQFKYFIEANGFADIYLVGGDTGMVLFSERKGSETGSALLHGRLQNSGLARVWKKVLATNGLVFEDFSPYEPSSYEQAAFAGCPVRDSHDRIVGVMIARLDGDFINTILSSRQGLGESGESYLLRMIHGQNRFELRSDLQTLGQGSYVVGYTLDRTPQYWRDALQAGYDGGEGIYKDTADTSVLVTFSTVDVLGEPWILISKINRLEVLRPIWTFLLAISVTGFLLILAIAPGAYALARRISQPLEQGVTFAEAISSGDLKARLELPHRDELGMLARALNRMARNLRELDWLSSGRTGLDDALRGEHTPDELTREFITFLCHHLDAQIGLCYLLENDELVFKAGYAYADQDASCNRLRMGEGLVGQAALERDILTYSQPRDGAPLFRIGPAGVEPRCFLAAPIMLDNKLTGAFLLGSKHEFLKQQVRFVRDIIPSTAVLLNMAASRSTITELLRQAQQQQEELQVTNEELEAQTKMLLTSQAELQAQQEELQVTNEELAEQTTALRESERRLQAQQEELRSVNTKMAERAQELERQKIAIRRKNKALLRAQEQLKFKARELEVASRYKSEFLANMSHELRTPLNSILILSQLLAQNKDGNLTPRQTESASAIHSSGSDLLRLINEILDLSKVEAGKVELQLDTLPFETMISDLQRVFKGMAVDKGLTFDVDLGPNLPSGLVTDGHRLQQILRNLLSNAFKFTDHGSVTLSIFRPGPDMALDESLFDRSRTVCLAVRDMGIGIPREKQDTIFEAFRQADGSTSRKYGGTGLGLSISRELSRLLGGELQLESQEGQGSTFTLILPDVHEDAVEPDEFDGDDDPAGKPQASPDSPEPSSPQESYVPDDRGNLQDGDKVVLIIEDDPHFALTLNDRAHAWGFKTLIASEGETGLHFADYYSPCAVVLDISLPGMGGWKVMERLKGDIRTRHIPVFFISGEDRAMEAMRLGALGFLEKPVDDAGLELAFGRIKDFVNSPVRRLLIVDDDALQRRSIQALIGNGDVESETAASGAEALQMLHDHHFDCMILDLGLSDISGFEVLQDMRATPALAALPVVVYTGRELNEDEERLLSQYAESIIVKGVRSPERLLEETTLFLHRRASSLPRPAQKVINGESERESSLADRHILVVDDDMRNVFALTSVLEEKGMHILVARDGRECLTKMHEHPEIELVLMDIMMPSMDGYEAMRAIRANKAHAGLPIIALTAKAMKGDKNRCIEAGANDYLSKPVDKDKLISLLRVWLYNK